jgi:hypothetical protein
MHGLLLMAMTAANAQDVLLPHFSPNGLADISAAESIERKMLGGLQSLGLPVVPPSVLEQEFPISTQCAENPDCPSILFSRDDSIMLIVGRVEVANQSIEGEESGDTGYKIQVRIYSVQDTSPLQIFTEEVSDNDLEDFIRRVSQEASVIFQLIPPAEPEEVVAEAPPLPPPPVVFAEPEAPKEKAKDPRIERLPKKLRASYASSPLSADDWLKANRVRSQNVIVNIGFGVSFGDVTRRYDTRYGYYPFENNSGEQDLGIYGIYQYDAFIPDTGFNAGFGVGFAPLWWLETSIYGGAILASKELSTGWQKRLTTEKDQIQQDDVVNYDPITAATGVIEPQVRLYFVPSGPVKPYLLAGGFIRLYDVFVVPDIKTADFTVDYSDRPSGVHFGSLVAPGLVFDSVSPVSVFIEVPWVYLINAEATTYSNYELRDDFAQYGMSDEWLPTQVAPSNMIVSFRAGVSLRFH